MATKRKGKGKRPMAKRVAVRRAKGRAGAGPSARERAFLAEGRGGSGSSDIVAFSPASYGGGEFRPVAASAAASSPRRSLKDRAKGAWLRAKGAAARAMSRPNPTTAKKPSRKAVAKLAAKITRLEKRVGCVQKATAKNDRIVTSLRRLTG